LNFRRLTAGHVIALVGALALLLVMAPDWYTDKTGEQDRFFQKQIVPQLNTQTEPSESEKQAEAAERHEKNAWQAPGAIDKLILLGLLATVALAVASAYLRAAGRRRTPVPLVTIIGLATAALIAYRIIQPPGLNEAAVVKWGAPAGLVCVGIVTFGARIATRAEREPAPEAPAPAANAAA
jgi:drug/metabolite transporter (DMT)-like permease